jgi:hypothetical protein
MGPFGKESKRQIKPAKRSFKRTMIEGCACQSHSHSCANKHIINCHLETLSHSTTHGRQAQAFSLSWQENSITYLVSILSSEKRVYKWDSSSQGCYGTLVN